MKKAILLTIALFFAFGLSGCSYNDLTAKQQKVKSNWAGVDHGLQLWRMRARKNLSDGRAPVL